MPPETATRERADRCPGVTRPWPAEDGSLVRIRVVGGALPTSALASLVDLAGRFGDGDLHLTKRANLQLRAVAGPTCVRSRLDWTGCCSPSRRSRGFRGGSCSSSTTAAATSSGVRRTWP